jgi:hypothetical protein
MISDYLHTTNCNTVGSVGLFVSRDQYGGVNHRVAVKDTYWTTKTWETGPRWMDQNGVLSPGESVFNEMVVNAFEGQEPSVVQCIATGVDEARCMNRFYMEFCELVWQPTLLALRLSANLDDSASSYSQKKCFSVLIFVVVSGALEDAIEEHLSAKREYEKSGRPRYPLQ